MKKPTLTNIAAIGTALFLVTITIWRLSQNPQTIPSSTSSKTANMEPIMPKAFEQNQEVAKLARIVDDIQPVKLRQDPLPHGFTWTSYESYDSLALTTASVAAQIEISLFKFMKQIQIKCPQQVRIGHAGDGGWDVCTAGPFSLNKSCLVYSVGLARDWSFDEMITTKYGCQDMAYDPSIGKQDHKPSSLLWFFNTGLGGADMVNSQSWRIRTFPSLLRENNHTRATIDILKIDIEYAEWDSLIAILSQPSCLDNVKQLMVEFHSRELLHQKQTAESDLMTYWHIARGIDRLGFKLWTFWDNPSCWFVSKRTPGLRLCGCFNAYYVNTRLL